MKVISVMTRKKETTTTAQTPAPEKIITEEQVSDYLREHPDFLSRNVDVVADQAAPGRWQENSVIDMQQFMVTRLQEEMESLRSCTQEVIETGRKNMSNQFRTHKAILSIVSATSFNTALRIVADEWPLLLDVDTVALCFEPPPLQTLELVSSNIIQKSIPRKITVGSKPISTQDLEVWQALANCEAGGNWDTNTGNGYYGGLQINPVSWSYISSTLGIIAKFASDATMEEQIAVGRVMQEASGWGQWPACSSKLGYQ